MKTTRMYLMIIDLYLIILPFCGCSSPNSIEKTTDDGTVSLSMTVDEINSSSAITFEVSVSSSGSMTFVDKGLCYSGSNVMPTINDSIQAINVNKFMDYNLTLSNLKEVTTYYVRPFLRTKNAIYYGYVKKVKTLGSSSDYYATDKSIVPTKYDGYSEIWSDEFNTDGAPSSDWTFESGFVRNQELQWYQKDNASVKDGCLVIEGKKETVQNPNYVSGSTSWKTNRSVAEYTSSSLTTANSFTFKYGRMEVRAKIPVATGAWPAIWTLGNKWDWPMCGEIDLMEYYLKDNVPTILANACWSSDQEWTAIWNESKTPLSHFTVNDPDWYDKFHIWRMDWDENYISIYLDNELLNKIDVSNTKNQGYQGNYNNPFSNNISGFGDYIILNLAIGSNGGSPDDTAFPLRYKVDYVRVYQKN